MNPSHTPKMEGVFTLPSEGEVRRLAKDYAQAAPFPHIVIDNVISPALSEGNLMFPAVDWEAWSHFRDNYQFEKRACDQLGRFPDTLREMTLETFQAPFLQFLEGLTGIKGLIADPYLEGGGLHCTGPGGVLAPHTDFHLYGRLKLYRRLNVLIYLNDGWRPDNGGALELSAKGSAAAKSIEPIFGRMVVFNTDDQSVHGFPTPVAGRDRKSLALYFYTSDPLGNYGGDHSTHWQTHALGGVRLAAYRGLIFVSRAFSKLAYIVNPNF